MTEAGRVGYPEGTVAVIYVLLESPEALEVQLRPLKDALPYDRPLLAHLLRAMADQLDQLSAERQNL